MTTATRPKRKTAIDRAREKFENPAAPYDYPELPQAADEAFTFYAVYLGMNDGTFFKGPHPAFVKEESQTIVDETNPFQDPGFRMATTPQQQAILEKLRPNLLKDDKGREIVMPARKWVLVANKNQSYYEDPRVAAKTASPFVRKVTLYCPLNEPISGSGIREDHGAYPGINADVPDDYDDELGRCPKCAGNVERQQRALKQIANLHEDAKVPMNESLALRMAGKGL